MECHDTHFVHYLPEEGLNEVEVAARNREPCTPGGATPACAEG